MSNLDVVGVKFRADSEELKKDFEEIASTIKSTEGVTKEFSKNINQSMAASSSGVGGLGKSFSSLPGPIGNAVNSLKSLIAASRAFIATPIGAILTVIALAIAGVVAAFKKFAPLVDAVANAMAGMSGIIQEVINRVQQFGAGLMDIINGDFDKGMEKISASTDNLADSLGNAYREASALEKELRAISDAKRADSVQDSATEAQIDILIAKSKNLALTFKERAKLLEEAKKLELEKYNDDVKLIEREIKAEEDGLLKKTQLNQKELKAFVSGELLREQVIDKMGSLQEEDLDKLAALYVQRNDLEKESVGLQERINSRMEGMQEREQQEKDKNFEKEKQREEKKKELKMKLAAEELNYQSLVVSAMEDGMEKTLAMAALEYEKQKLQLDGQHKALAQLEINYQALLKDIVENAEKQRLQEQQNRHKEFLAGASSFLGELQKRDKDYNDLRISNIKDEEAKAAEIENQRYAAEKERLKNNHAALEELEVQHQNNLSDIQKIAAEKDLANKMMIQESAAQGLNSLAALFINDQGKLAQMQARIALGEIAINTGRAISNLVTVSFSPSSPDNILTGGLAAYAKLATGLATILGNVAQAKQYVMAGFAKGTDSAPGGWAMVGEQGPEMMYVPKGAMISPADKTSKFREEMAAMRANRFDDLITTKYVLPELEKMANSGSLAERLSSGMRVKSMLDDTEIIHAINKQKPATARDIDRLGKTILSAQKEMFYRNKKEWRG